LNVAELFRLNEICVNFSISPSIELFSLTIGASAQGSEAQHKHKRFCHLKKPPGVSGGFFRLS
jgi:hypothetical protein